MTSETDDRDTNLGMLRNIINSANANESINAKGKQEEAEAIEKSVSVSDAVAESIKPELSPGAGLERVLLPADRQDIASVQASPEAVGSAKPESPVVELAKPFYAQPKALQPNLSPASNSGAPAALDRYSSQLPFRFDWCKSDADFRALIEEVKKAIKSSILPERIPQGSSGSYFAKDMEGRIVGVFKPKNEEPYGAMNPKWSKYLQRICCPCTFGRSCLPTNQGYCTEVAASVVDRYLRLNVVPRTEVAELSSPSFHYGHWIRRGVERRKRQHQQAATMPADDPYGTTLFPRKSGSFQLFVQGFREAGPVLEEWERRKATLPAELDEAFQAEFERLVILDYAIRNTDRGMDNWLINVAWVREGIAEHEIDGRGDSPRQAEVAETFEDARYEANARGENVDNTIALMPPTTRGRRPVVKIAAIDNGLALPFKHPDKWRSYPYGWAELPWVDRPFSDRTIAEFLPILADPGSWDELVSRLRGIFQLDDDFSPRTFRRQMSVLRGQLFNLREALRRRETPRQLIERPWLKIEDLADIGPERRFLGDTYSADPRRIWHIRLDDQSQFTTTDRQLLNEDHVDEQYRDAVPPQRQRWKTFVRERPYFAYL